MRRGGFTVVQFFVECGFPTLNPGAIIVMGNYHTHHNVWGAQLQTLAAFSAIKIKYLPKYSPAEPDRVLRLVQVPSALYEEQEAVSC